MASGDGNWKKANCCGGGFTRTRWRDWLLVRVAAAYCGCVFADRWMDGRVRGRPLDEALDGRRAADGRKCEVDVRGELRDSYPES